MADDLPQSILDELDRIAQLPQGEQLAELRQLADATSASAPEKVTHTISNLGGTCLLC